MKTFTVILTTVTFLVFAFLAMIIVQEEPEVIPPDNLTSGITDSSAQKSAVDQGSQRSSFSGSLNNNQPSDPANSVKQPSSIRNRDNHIASSPSGSERNTRNIKSPNPSRNNPQNQNTQDIDTRHENTRKQESSFTMTNQEVDDEVRRIRHRQMETLETIINRSND